MGKYFKNIPASVLVLTLIFAVSGLMFPQITRAQVGQCWRIDQTPPQPMSPSITEEQCRNLGAQVEWRAGTPVPTSPEAEQQLNPSQNSSQGSGFWGGFANAVLWIPGAISIGILKIASLLTYLAGALLNLVVQYSVVDMKANISKAETIDTAWRAIRDVANMAFIFVLLYAAIQTILGIGKETQKLIVRVIVIAILINFSLFFTKLVIDASNVLAITFYDAIAPGALTGTAEGILGKTGIADSLMRPLNLTSIWNAADGLSGSKLLTIGVMGTIVTLIAAFVFFAVAIMFIIRFVVLIFVLILSPLAFVGFILPATEKYRDQWKEALIGQAFFAPIYFLLTWIVIKVSRGLLTGGGDMATALTGTIGSSGQAQAPTPENLGILVNFIVMIVLLIASLIIAKEWANKAPGGVSKLTGWAMGAAGGATLGVAGRFGRGTLGRAGGAIGESERLKEAAAKGGASGMAARLALATGRKTAKSSFDIRGTDLGGTLEAGKAGGKGGFAEFRKKKAEAEAKFAISLAPSAKAVAKDKALSGNKEEIDEKLKDLDKEKSKRVEEIRNNEELIAAEKKERSAYDAVSRLEAEAQSTEGTVTADKIKELEVAKRKLEEIKKEAGTARQKVKEETERITTEYENRTKALKKMVVIPGDERRKAFAETIENSYWAKARGYNYDAAAQIRKGKSAKDKAADILKDLQKEGVITEEEKPEVPPSTPAGGTAPNP